MANQNNVCTEDALYIHIILYKFYAVIKDSYANEYFEEYDENHTLLVTLTKSEHISAIKILCMGILEFMEDTRFTDIETGILIEQLYDYFKRDRIRKPELGL